MGCEVSVREDGGAAELLIGHPACMRLGVCSWRRRCVAHQKINQLCNSDSETVYHYLTLPSNVIMELWDKLLPPPPSHIMFSLSLSLSLSFCYSFRCVVSR